jgi:hypothetical protein
MINSPMSQTGAVMIFIVWTYEEYYFEWKNAI